MMINNNNNNRLLENAKQPNQSTRENCEPLRKQMAARAADIAPAVALRSVLLRVRQAAERSWRAAEDVRVVAISKTKPVSLIRQLYDAGHRCFGENYVQEIVDKAPQLPEDIQWHFTGHLQSNKVKSLLAAVPNLDMVEGVDNEKIANHLDRAVNSSGRKPLKVLVQVNTSGEESKSGVDPSRCVELVKHVNVACPHLLFSGLMTIGMRDYTSTPENFKALSNCKLEMCKALGLPMERLELSMGMSSDFEQAVRKYGIIVYLRTFRPDWVGAFLFGQPGLIDAEGYDCLPA